MQGARQQKSRLLRTNISIAFMVKLFSIPEAIDALKENFDVYGTSPRFITDWRWYKDIIGKDRGFNEVALNDYYNNNLNFLDYRYVFKPHSLEFGKKLEVKCCMAWDLMCRLESEKLSNWNPIWELLDEIHTMISKPAPITALALREAIDWLQNGSRKTALRHFESWWGQGSQYVSFIRK